MTKVLWSHARIKGRLPPRLLRCPACSHHIYASAKKCPHCGGELQVLREKQLKALESAQQAIETLKRLFPKPE